MSNGIELMILSILGPTLGWEWSLTKWEKAFLSKAVFIGWIFGGPLWGKFCDHYGRKIGIVMSTFITFYFGLLSSWAPNLIWLYILRGFVGFGISGSAQTFTLLGEFSPKESRTKSSLWIIFFWPIGFCLAVGLAIILMPGAGWRWLLAVSCIPSLISGLFSFWIPESARFQIETGKFDLAFVTLEKISQDNKIRLPAGTLAKKNFVRGNFIDLFSKKHWLNTIILWLIWFTNTFSFYGLVLLVSQLFLRTSGGNVCLKNEVSCINYDLERTDYYDLFFISLAEFPALLVSWFLLEYLGPKKTLSIGFLGYSLFIFLINLCIERSILVFFSAIARCAIKICIQSAYVYTPEYYPTPIRALGVGCCTGMARFGALITPFVSQVLFESSPRLAICIYGMTTLIAAFLPFLLPRIKERDSEES